MARTFLEVQTDILKRIARTDDEATTIVQTALNHAIEIVSIAYDIPALHTTLTYSYTGSASYMSLITSDHILDIIKVYAGTVPLGFIPFDVLDSIVPSGDPTGKYWSRDGNRIYVRNTPTVSLTLSLHVRTYPAWITSTGDSIPFEGHDSELVAIGTMLAWAALEENESVDMWKGISSILNIPYEKAIALSKIMEGLPESKEMAYGNQPGGAAAQSTAQA